MAAEGNNNQPSNPNTAVSAAGMSPKRTTSPPWNQIVSEIDAGAGGDSNAKKPVAWNKKPTTSSINGEIAVSGGTAVVMGAELWPSLSECTTKSSPKLSSSSDSSIIVPGFGSTLSPQVSGINTSLTTTGARLQSLASQKSSSSNSNQHMTSYHARPARQKSFKRDGGGNPQSNGMLSHQPSQQAGEGAHYQHSHGSPKPNPSRSSESSGMDNVQNHSHRDSGPRSASGDHHHQRNPFRKGNGGPHPRGDGSHQNYGSRRNDQERGNHDFNHQRNGRDMQPRGAPRALVVAPPASAPLFYGPPLVPPFLNPAMPVFLPSGMQIVPTFSPVYLPAPGPELSSELTKQINYYFSVDNLVRDTYLREHMDENGWVHVDVISKFNRVRVLTNDTYQILEAVRSSTVVEVQGEKIRKRDDWKKWVIPPSVQFPPSGSQSPKSPSVPAVTDHTQNLSLDDKINHRSNAKDQIDGSAATLKASSGVSKSALKSVVNQANPSGC